VSRLSGKRLISIYLDFRSRGAQSSLGTVGQGHSGQPSSDVSPAGMMAATIGLSMSRCPFYFKGCAWRGSILELYARLSEGRGDWGMPSIDEVEKCDEFKRALVWLDEDIRRRLDVERGKDV
jgi:hypothetical protein